MFRARIDKTFDKVRAGELPAPSAVRVRGDSGRRIPCSGCGETIEASERYCCGRVSGAALHRFHLVCHEVWLRFRRDP